MTMKRYIIAALALIGFTLQAHADTSKLTAADGWTKITAMPSATDIANNYYVFVDNTKDLMLGVGKGVHQDTKWYSLGLYYYTSAEPASKEMNNMVWTLESYSGGYTMRNLEYSVFLFQTENNAPYKWDTNDVKTPNGWAKINLAYSDGSWTIENGHDAGNYIGPWTAGDFNNGAECAGNKTGNNIGHFQIYAISRIQFKQNLLDNASASNPVDITPWYVTNATFDANNSDGWETTFSANASNWWGSHAFNHLGAENYQQMAEVKQTLTLPNGSYKVSLQGASNKVSENLAYVFATYNGNTQKTYFTQSTVSTPDKNKWNDMQYNLLLMMQNRSYGQVQTAEITVSTGSLTIGYKNEGGWSWDVYDNFKLYCTGLDLSAYVDQLSDLVSECNTFISSGVVPDACENAISSAVSTYNQSYTTAKKYSNAIVQLTNVLNTYRNDEELKSAYARFKDFKTHVEGLTTGQGSSSALTTFNSAVSNASAAAEDATTVSAINAQIPNLRSAALTYISSVEGQFDITFMASQNTGDWKKKDGSAAGEVTWAVSNRGDWSFAESYESTCATTGTVLYQTMDDLPEGYYYVGMYAMAAYTPGRNFDTQATEGDANRSYAFAGNLNDAGSIMRTGIPIPFKTTFDFSELTTLDVNVHLASTAALTFGVQKDANGSNWHFAQIASVIYSKDPDLTGLMATRDALVAEAAGIKNGANGELLTDAQKTDLQSAIDAGNAANTFDALNTVTLTTLPNAINTAKQQIQIVKTNRVLMIVALERFENDYNLADGTDYSRLKMSAGAWTDLLTKVDAVTTALDDVSLASEYETRKNNLVAQMDATDVSLRLFKSYKAMFTGVSSFCNIQESASWTDSDAAEQAAITEMNTAFTTYSDNQTDDFSVSAFLGGNLDFSAAEGDALNTENSNNIHEVAGWEVSYADADAWAQILTHKDGCDEKLYMRKNWGDAATKLMILKEKMLPVGKYKLTLSWNSNMENMANRSQFKVGDAAIAIGEVSDGTEPLEYQFEVTEAAKPFDLVIGFQKSGTGDKPAQIIVDDITLTCLGANNRLLADYDAGALWFDATSGPYKSATNITVTPSASNQLIKAASASQFSGLTKNVIVDGTCANLVLTDGSPLQVDEPFTATDATYSRNMANNWGTVILPFAVSSNDKIQFYRLKASDADAMTFETVDAVDANTPVAFKKLSGEGIVISGSDVSVAVTTGQQNDNTTATDWSAEGSYTAQSLTEFDGVYYIASNKFWAADAAVTLNPFRAIFRYSGSNAVKQLGIEVEDNITTAVVGLDADTATQEWYDLSGRRVSVNARLPKGMYIVNGKKVMIK